MSLNKFPTLILIIPILLFISASSLSYGQILTGKITGVVTDEEGSPLPAVTIEASSPSFMGQQTAVTSGKGTYRLANLPPGLYKVVFTLPGFQRVEREDIKVTINTTVTLIISMRPETLAETVEVTAKAPVIDVTNSGMSTSFSSEDINNIPAGRHSFADIIKQAPGMLAQEESGELRWSFAGSGVQANAIYYDGVDQSSPELGIPWTNPGQDIFEEVEVSGVGIAAEYGLITGAVINIVTKSGGNKFEGALSHYGQYDFLTGDNNPDPEVESFKRFYRYDQSFTLGGPMVKDKFWFFGNYTMRRSKESPWQSDPDYARTDKHDEVFFKVTSNITNKHKLVASFSFENEDYGEVPDEWNPIETLIKEICKTYVWNIRYTWLASSNSIFDIKYAGWYSPDEWNVPIGGADINKRSHIDDATGVRSVAPEWSTVWYIDTHQVNAGFSHFAEDFLGADHDFKIGAQYTRGGLEAKTGYCGGGTYIDYYGEPYLLYVQQQYMYGGTVNRFGVFFDDSIRIGKRLTLNLGVRYDYQQADYPAFPRLDGWNETTKKAPGIDDLITWNVISPRIGIAFQLTPDGKTLLKANYGRYHDALYIGNFAVPGPGVTDWYGYEWIDGKWELFDYAPGGIGYIMDPDIKNPYADQLFIGLDRELFPNFSVGANYLYKKEENSIGFEGRNATYEQVQRVSSDNGQTYTVFDRISPPGVEETWQTNPEAYGQTYNAFILSFDKKYSQKWMMSASITWSHSSGLTMNAHQTRQDQIAEYASGFGVDPNDLINAEGDLQHDKRWVVKFTGGYNLPWDIFFGAYFTYQTGRPRPTFVRISDLEQGRTTILAEPRGDERYPSFYTLSLRLQKQFTLSKSLRLKVMLDLFNATNDDTFRSWHSNNRWYDTFNLKWGLPDPRSVQLGLKLEF
jgi:hypothetical protein